MADVSLDDLPAPPTVSLDDLPSPPETPPTTLDRVEDVARGAGKGIVERAVAIPGMAADALYAAGNLVNAGVDKVAGRSVPGFEQQELPTQTLDRLMSKAVGPTKTGLGKTAQFLAGVGPTAQGIETGERALFGMTPTQIAKLQIAGQPIPAAEKIARASVDAGFKIPPSELPRAPIGRGVQSVAGKARAEEEFSAKNWPRAQDLARAEFHLPEGTEFDEKTLGDLKQPGYDAYEDLKALNGGKPFNVTLDYLSDVSKAGEEGGQAAVDFPGKPDSRILELRGQMSQFQFTAPGAVQKIKELRNVARAIVHSGGPGVPINPADAAYAKANQDIAEALEVELGRVAKRGGKPGLVQEYRNARQYLARVYAVEDATNLAGQVAPRALAGLQAKGVKLTGNLKTIADAATQFPKAFQDVGKKGRMGPWTVFDLWALAAGAGSTLGAHVHGLPLGEASGAGVLGVAGASIARPVARAALATKPLQKMMTRPASQRLIESALRKHGTVGNIAGITNQYFGESPDTGQ